MIYVGYSLMSKDAFDAMWEEETEGDEGDLFDMTDEELDDIICDVCGKPITGKDYDERHQGHEDDCPNKRLAGDDDEEYVDCFCALEYHAACCPDCKEVA